MRLMWLYAGLALFLVFDVWAVWILVRALLGSQETLDLEFKLRVDDRILTTGKRTRESQYARAL
jgi:hypothetical protein